MRYKKPILDFLMTIYHMRSLSFFGFFLANLLLLKSINAAPLPPDLNLDHKQGQLPTTEVDTGPSLSGYDLKLTLSDPIFTKIQYYSSLYPTSVIIPGFFMGYTVRNPFVGIGWGVHLNYFSANGHSSTSASAINPGAITPSEDKTSLTISSIDFLVSIETSPFFSSRWVTLQGWGGYQEAYYEETRTLDDAAAAAATAAASTPTPVTTSVDPNQTTPSTTTPTATPTSTANNSPYMNSGWNAAIVVGGALNILLSPLDQKSTASMRSTMKLNRVYLTPFFEIISVIKPSKTFIFQGKTTPVDFSRELIGIGISFEG